MRLTKGWFLLASVWLSYISAKEFISIIDCGNGKIRDSWNLACGNINDKEKYPKYKSPTINMKLFPNTMIGSYWTSKTTVNDPTAEKIDFVAR